MIDLQAGLGQAVQQFWKTRHRQSKTQGARSGRKDQGGRTAVTGGRQLDGFVDLIHKILLDSGLHDATIFRKGKIELPGFFRPTKEWDLLVVSDGILLAAVEFKSHVGPSFGNNYNNRTEEALGNATDLKAAYREGAFAPSPKPWLGYLMLLEAAPGSLSPVAVAEPHFKVFEEFRAASYAKRYELLCKKLVREQLYDAACLVLSDQIGGPRGEYQEPNSELGFLSFVTSLTARAIAHTKTRGQGRG